MKDLPKYILIALVSSFLTVLLIGNNQPEITQLTQPIKIITQESAIIDVAKNTSPSVVSIAVTDNFDYFFWPTEKREIGGGTGFVVGEKLILTNKHVASDQNAEYTIMTNQEEIYNAKILAIDPIYDIAILEAEIDLPALILGDSSKLEIGQTVVAIGNALAEFDNTVSSGIVSGLKRSIGADLRSLIQTDAAINNGNSGGPLLNLAGEVIGINTAKAPGAENIGFAIPINLAKKAIQDVKTKGKIEYPFLGIKYNINNHVILEVIPESPADKAGLQMHDILLEFDNIKLNKNNLLSDIILDYNSGDKIKLKILRNGETKIIISVLDAR